MTISLRLDKRLARRVQAAAKARGVSKSELIRRCLEEYLTRGKQRPRAWELGKDLFGCYSSGRGDLSEQSETIAGERIRAKHAHKSHR